MNAVEIQGRRALIFRYKSLELTPLEMLALISEKYPVSIETVRRDLRSIDQWLPGILGLGEGEANMYLFHLVGHLQLARKRLINLMYSTRNESVVAGAAKGVGILADKEAQLLMDAGKIARAPFRAELLDSSLSPEEIEEFENKAFEAIGKNMMEEEKRQRKNVDMERSHPGESSGMVSVEKLGRPERVAAANGGWTEASLPDHHAKDTSKNGTRIGGYIQRRR